MKNSMSKMFYNADELRSWHQRWHNGYDEPDEWGIGPDSVLSGFELDDDDGLYCEGEDVSDIPHTIDVSDFFSSAGVWNDSLENLQNELDDNRYVQITICYDEPLVDPEAWEFMYDNPSSYLQDLMDDYYDRQQQQQDAIVSEYSSYVDGFFCVEEYKYSYDFDDDLATEAKQLIDGMSPEQEKTFMQFLWSDIIATELSEKEVEVEKSYLRAKDEFEKLSADKVFKEPFDYLRILKTCEES